MKNEEYMTGWEILASIFLFAMIFGTAWLFLLITYQERQNNEYAVHYLVDDNADTKNMNNWKTETFYFLDEAERFYDTR